MLSKNQETQISKFLSFVLRHKPETISLHLDSEGWVDVVELLDKSKKEITFTRHSESVLLIDKIL